MILEVPAHLVFYDSRILCLSDSESKINISFIPDLFKNCVQRGKQMPFLFSAKGEKGRTTNYESQQAKCTSIHFTVLQHFTQGVLELCKATACS